MNPRPGRCRDGRSENPVKMTILYFLLFLVVLIGPDVRIYASCIAGTCPWAVKILWWLPTAATLTAFVCANRGWYHNTCMRAFFALVLCFVLPKGLFVLFHLLIGWQVALAAVAVVELFLLYGFFFGWRRIVVKDTVCADAAIPKAFDGYRVLQLSDIHIGTFLQNPSFIGKLVNVVNAQQPDLVVFTGDLVNVSATELLPFMSVLDHIHATDGVYSVMGNHDYCEYGHDHTLQRMERNQHALIYMEEKMEWHMLMNEHVLLQRGGSQIALVGVENIGKPPFKSHGNLGKAVKDLPDGMFKILLSHDPTHWRMGVLQTTDIQLTLSGHTHAGQFKIGRFSPSRWAYNEWGGMYTEDGRHLHVSLGIGGTVPFRFGAWPEVNVITLSSVQKK